MVAAASIGVANTAVSKGVKIEVAEFRHARAIHGANEMRIPERTCHKLLNMNSCDLKKCHQECSKKPLGVGQSLYPIHAAVIPYLDGQSTAPNGTTQESLADNWETYD
ncbi:hypothetical protein SADUNF_Sadunf06G0152800 [Salix dunnii]|uniref:Uncharacterized protein n=1 Tax=Salix dunnii TaxID=1413687 RepID=A0A835K1Z5_9ROSI|nr:hypothetical protein SADUNF_Sadunf06G0152800 [Salix dunnii]